MVIASIYLLNSLLLYSLLNGALEGDRKHEYLGQCESSSGVLNICI